MLAKPFVMKRPRIEMVPLIDMFFLLLVFFIFGVFSMTMQQGIAVDLPTAATGITTEDKAITISVTTEGLLTLDQQPITLEALPEVLGARRASQPEALVVINADRRVAHGVVMTVLDAIRQAGFARVSFRTAPEPT